MGPDGLSETGCVQHLDPEKDECFLTTNEAASYLRVSKSYLDKLRVYGGSPRFLRFGRKILYRQSELNLWAEERCFGSTSEYEVGVPPMRRHARPT